MLQLLTLLQNGAFPVFIFFLIGVIVLAYSINLNKLDVEVFIIIFVKKQAKTTTLLYELKI